MIILMSYTIYSPLSPRHISHGPHHIVGEENLLRVAGAEVVGGVSSVVPEQAMKNGGNKML